MAKLLSLLSQIARKISRITWSWLYIKSAVHVIYGDRSFTGDIVKYDTDRQRIIMKNFKRQVTSIIKIEDIKKSPWFQIASRLLNNKQEAEISALQIEEKVHFGQFSSIFFFILKLRTLRNTEISMFLRV